MTNFQAVQQEDEAMKGSTKLHYCRLLNGHKSYFQLDIRIRVWLDCGDGDEAPLLSLLHLDVGDPGGLALFRPQSLRVETLEEISLFSATH